MSTINHQVRLAARPVGEPQPTDWQHVEEPVGQPGDGEFLVQVLALSIDPAMRGWMNAGRSYIRPVEIGEVMRAGAVGRVIASQHPGFAVGDHVSGSFGVQEYCVSNGLGVTKVDPTAAPLPTYLGTLGMSGLTGYFGLIDIGRPEPGQTVVVSGAAGAVGSVVGQIAKIMGCRVIGIAGGEAKCRMIVDELGFDAAIDYRSEDVRKALRRHAPDGVDVYFDNVGGDILDAVLLTLARGARIIVCGAISQYNSTKPQGPANYLSLLVNRATMTGMVVFDYADRYAEGITQMATWRAEGRLKSLEDVVSGGVADFPDTLMRLFRGENHGKLVLKIAD
ncbi:Putative NADP-dependent oxidoreductase yfmJ [Streptomyces davaonensis JCM 4913]|uniref:Putative NADP-dependent oxidoreductase yfmJ n=1 Tax=Streptomyces davaonensis (strain DSM 101723 / JCM 4913 / KCC S-0913 / 768) TaxID=1214101 RepID=K4QT28_STRDJ|nr:NADP-dependent oxidoreductase [Streptomyces davaonensis]CCK25676.1 Putative NADP-dependent oxidoreductase yfmJ [Streptomyces davaonensis JCM 4913]